MLESRPKAAGFTAAGQLLNPTAEQPLNPGAEQRRVLTLRALATQGRSEDYENITEAFSIPQDINTIAPPGSCQGKKAGIIGGGLAGLSAAFELRKAGFDITIFEADPERIGGRVFTYYFDSEKKLYGELGAMRLPVSHETVWHYIDLFGLDTRPFIQTNPAALIYLHGKRVRNDPWGENVRRHIYPTYDLTPNEYAQSWQQLGYLGIEATVMKAPPLFRKEILEVLPLYSQWANYWDSLSTRQAMERQGLSQGAINLLSSLFPIAGAFLSNSYIDLVQEYYPANFVYMYEIPGGMAKLPYAFYDSLSGRAEGKYCGGLPAGLLGNVAWKGGCAVKGIYLNTVDNAVTLAYNQKGTYGTLYGNFDYVVCTVPFSVLRVFDIKPSFTSLKMQAIREVTYSPAHKTVFRCARRFWEEQGIYGGGSYTDLPVSMLWYPSSSPGGTSYAAGANTGISGVYGGNMNPGSMNPGGGGGSEGVLLAYNFNMDAVRVGNLPDEARFTILKREIEEVHGLTPGWLDPVMAEFKTQFWNRDPFYRGTFCYFTPQQKNLFSYAMTQPEYGSRVFFAGEHISPLHRWMQGALKSGMEAANAVAWAATRGI
mgnify:CR=1 FL=1